MLRKVSTPLRRACLGLGITLIAVAGCIKVEHRLAMGWSRYRPPATAGTDELRVRQLMLSDQSLEQRFDGLFAYFARGFVRHALPGYARVQYGGAGSSHGYAMDGLEGFARTAPLLAVWLYSGRGPVDGIAPAPGEMLAMLRSGILNGVDPQSPQYWGPIADEDQRIVEAADIARVVWLTRASLWSTLSDEQRQLVRAWLQMAANKRTPPNNWMLFPVVIDLVLADLSEDAERQQLQRRAHQRFEHYKQYYLEDGWFADPPEGVDYYNTWSITYELFWLHRIDPGFEPEFIAGAIRSSAQLTQYLISPDGIPILGRSVCYRTAVPVPLIAASLLQPQPLPAGRAARGLDLVWRYFVLHDSLRDGALTQGYFDADMRVLDVYSGTGSCQWGLRSMVLAFMHPPGEAFWVAAEEPLPVEERDYRLELTKLGWIIEGHRATGEITITLPSNAADVDTLEQHSWPMRLQETLLQAPRRPDNHKIKYESRHYSSASPYPLKD